MSASSQVEEESTPLKTSRPRLRGTDAFHSRTNEQALRALHEQDASTSGVRRSCFLLQRKPKGSSLSFASIDDLLYYSQDPMSTSILKMKRGERRKAVQLYSSAMEWCALTNSEKDASERNRILQSMIQPIRSESVLGDELHLQLIKLTRGNPDGWKEKHAWQLLLQVISLVPCSQEVQELVMHHGMTTAGEEGQCPRLRRLADSVVDAFHNKDVGTGRSCLRHLNTRYLRFHTVLLSTGDGVELLYDFRSIVGHIVPQISQTIGLIKQSTFGVYDLNGDRLKPLNDDVTVESLLHRGWQREIPIEALCVRKRCFRRPEEEIDDPLFVRLLFHQSKEMYLRGDYPVEDVDLCSLCSLLILTDPPEDLLTNDDVMKRVIVENMPPQYLSDDRPTDDCFSCIRRDCSVFSGSRAEAGRNFLKHVRNLIFGNAFFYPVEIRQFPSGDLRQTDLLGINRNGVHFFQCHPRRCLHSFHIARLDIIKRVRTVFVLQFRGDGRPSEIKTKFFSDFAREICTTLNIHLNDFKKGKFENERHRITVEKERSEALSVQTESDTIVDGDQIGDGRFPTASRERPSIPRPNLETLDSPYLRGLGAKPRSIGQNGPTDIDRIEKNEEGMRGPSLESLKEGDIFVDRYQICAREDSNGRHIFQAVDLERSDKPIVRLELFSDPTAFEQTRALYHMTKWHSNLNTYDLFESPTRDDLPFFSTEKPKMTLRQWIADGRPPLEQSMDILMQILQGLETLHRIGRVYRRLSLDTVGQFERDGCWKLLDVCRSPSIGTTIPSEIQTSIFTSPEVFRAIEEGSEVTVFDPKIDIWEFGILASVLLTGRTPYGSETVSVDVVKNRLETVTAHLSIDTPSDVVRRFLDRLLFINPVWRPSAKELLTSPPFSYNPFRNPTISSQKLHEDRITSTDLLNLIDELKQLQAREQERDRMLQRMCERLHLMQVTARINIQSYKDMDDLWNFSADPDRDQVTTTDDQLPGEPIFLLNLERSYILRVILEHASTSRLPVRRCTRVSLKAPDSDVWELETTTRHDGSTLEILAHVDATKFLSERLKTVSPSFGYPEEKHVLLEVRIGLIVDDGDEEETEMRSKIYVKMCSVDDRLTMHRAERFLRSRWDRCPQWFKRGIRGSLQIATALNSTRQ